MNPAEFANIARAERELWWYRGMNRMLLRLLDRWVGERAPRRVLEAGCGTGYLAGLLERRGWPIHAIDLGWEGLRHARRNGLTRIAQSDVRALPFPDGAFDVVLSMDVLPHLERGREQPAFDELARVLAPGGLLILRVAALDILRSRHSEFVGERQRFTRRRLLGHLGSAGLEPVRATYANSLLLPVAFTRFRIWEPLTRKPPSSGVAPVPRLLNQALYACLCVESALIGAGINFPLGQSLLVAARKPVRRGAAEADSSRVHSAAARR